MYPCHRANVTTAEKRTSIAFRARMHSCCLTHADISPVFHQQPDDLGMAPLGCSDERRGSRLQRTPAT